MRRVTRYVSEAACPTSSRNEDCRLGPPQPHPAGRGDADCTGDERRRRPEESLRERRADLLGAGDGPHCGRRAALGRCAGYSNRFGWVGGSQLATVREVVGWWTPSEGESWGVVAVVGPK